MALAGFPGYADVWVRLIRIPPVGYNESLAMNSTSSPIDAITELAGRLDELIRSSPLADVQKNLGAQWVAQLARQGLVTREEYEIQVALLEKARAKLTELEAKIAALEAARK